MSLFTGAMMGEQIEEQDRRGEARRGEARRGEARLTVLAS